MSFSEPTSQPSSEQTPEFVSARARRRRAQRRAYFPIDEEGRAALFEHLARRAFPSYELFVFSLVAGAILGLGYFFNAQALLIFGVLVAPLLTPWIGTALSIIAGALRLFVQTFTALFVSSLIIFFCGLLAGFASRTFQPLTFNEAFTHSRLWWPDLIVLTIASILITISFVRSEDRPYLPSALLAYELFLPLCAAGFGLGSNISGLWPQGLFVFIVHLAWATFFGIITLFFLRFYPTSFGGLAFTGFIFIVLIAIVSSYTGFGNWIMIQAGLATPDPVAVITSTSTPLAMSSPSQSPKPAQTTGFSNNLTGTASQTPKPTLTTVTLAATETPTSTVTAEPTPILAVIRASEGGGAFIREKPGGTVLVTLGNGSTVTIIPNDLQDVNGVIWVHVFAIVNDTRVEGWMIQTVLQTATPVVDWQPSPTP
jgi:Predicted membrane protein